jgi:hypothetical protein
MRRIIDKIFYLLTVYKEPKEVIIVSGISISPTGKRRARKLAKAANDQRHSPPGKRKPVAAPEKDKQSRLIGRSQEKCRGKRYIITVRGDPETFNKLPEA